MYVSAVVKKKKKKCWFAAKEITGLDIKSNQIFFSVEVKML